MSCCGRPSDTHADCTWEADSSEKSISTQILSVSYVSYTMLRTEKKITLPIPQNTNPVLSTAVSKCLFHVQLENDRKNVLL